MHPYREAHPAPFSAVPEECDVVVVGVVVWSASVARTWFAFATHEAASRELALAVFLVFALPVIARPSRAR